MAKYPESLDDTPPPPRRPRRFLGRNLPGLSISLMVVLLVGVVLWPYMVITVPSGHVAVLWYRFPGFDVYCGCLVNRGTVLNPSELREEGLHVIAPWNRLFIYDLRLQSKSRNISCHLQGRRERDCPDQYAVSAAAQLCRRAA